MFLVYYLFNSIQAGIIAQSSINACYASSNSTKQNCTNQLLVTLTVQNSQNITTEYIQIANVSTSNLSLATPVTISVTKTPVQAIYPVVYLQDYNSQPLETKIQSSLFSCDDSSTSSSPTCGFQYYSNKSVIFNSQGFCCSCTLADILGLTDSYSRGMICSQAGFSTASMAFCMRYGTLWYSAYRVGTYYMAYNLTVNILYSDGTNSTIDLGSSVTVANASGVIATIAGDFVPLQPPPSFESYYLFKPSTPSTDARVLKGSAAYMMIPQSMVGSNCNQIGVSYSSFATQSSRCSLKVNSCLGNQIEQLYQADINTTTPTYLLSRWGTFTLVETNQTYLSYQIQGSMNTVITLQLSASSISFVTNLGKGTIDYAYVNNFVSQSGKGTLIAQITNIGTIASSFNTYLNCSVNVYPINAQAIALNPIQSYQINTQINVISDLNKSNICKFSLLDAVGNLLATKNITFNTTAVVPSNNTQSNTTSDEVPATDPVATTCSSCTLIKIYCYFNNACYTQIFTFFALIGVIILMLVCCYASSGVIQIGKCLKGCCKLLFKCIKCIFCCNTKNNNKKSKYKPRSQLNASESQSQISIIFTETSVMYINLTEGIDPIANHLHGNYSFEVLVVYQNNKVEKVTVRRDSTFTDIFIEVFGSDDKILKYLKNIGDDSENFRGLLTKRPVFRLL